MVLHRPVERVRQIESWRAQSGGTQHLIFESGR